MKALPRLIIACIFLAMSAAVTPAANAAAPQIGMPAPEFEAVGTDGQVYKLADHKGKVVVLEWTNYQCPFVRKFYDSGKMQELQKAYTDKGVTWFSIISSAPEKQGYLNAKDAPTAVAAEESKATAVLLDETGLIGHSYDARTTPHIFVINKEGMLVYAGAIDSISSTQISDIAAAENYAAAALEAVLAEKEVATASSTPYGCGIKYAQ